MITVIEEAAHGIGVAIYKGQEPCHGRPSGRKASEADAMGAGQRWAGQGSPLSPFQTVAGRVVRIDDKGAGPFSGQVFGGTLGIRGDDGRLYVMRHIDPLGFRVGARLRPGQHVGAPALWSGGDHIHFEIYPPGGSDREYSRRALNPGDMRWAG